MQDMQGPDVAEPVTEQIRAFMSSLDGWLKAEGVVPPQAVAEAAATLRTALPAQHTEPESPMDLVDGLSDGASTDGDADVAGSAKRAADGIAASREPSQEGREHRKRTPPPAMRVRQGDRAASW